MPWGCWNTRESPGRVVSRIRMDRSERTFPILASCFATVPSVSVRLVTVRRRPSSWESIRHLTQFQRFNEFQSTGDSDGTWDIGLFSGWTFSCKTIEFTPFAPAFWMTPNTYDPGAAALILPHISCAALKSGHVVGVNVVLADGSAHDSGRHRPDYIPGPGGSGGRKS